MSTDVTTLRYCFFRLDPSRSQVSWDIEFYKTQNGAYPTSLKALLASFPDTYVFDPTQVKVGNKQQRFFYYHLVGDAHYYLLGVGADGEAFTSDDIYPNVEVGPDSGVGLLIRNR